MTTDDQYTARRITFIYAVIASFWVLTGDSALIIAFDNDSLPEILAHSGKGILFVIITSFLLYRLLKWEFLQRQASEAQVRKSEALYRSLAHHFPNGAVFLFDQDLRFTLADGQELQNVGLAKDQMEGKTLREVFGEAADDLEPSYRSALAGTPVVFDRIRGDDIYEGRIVPMRGEDGTVQGGMTLVQDVTAQRRAQAELRERERMLESGVAQRTRELSTLLRVSREMTATLEIQPLLDTVLGQLHEVVDFTAAAVFEHDGNDVVQLVGQGDLDFDRLKPYLRGEFARQPTPRDVVCISDLERDASETAHQIRTNLAVGSPPLAIRWVSVIQVPLIIRDHLIGLLLILHPKPAFYDDRHAQLAGAFANQAAIAIQNARLYQQAQSLAVLQERQRLARELHDSVSQSLYSISLGTATSMELVHRDPEKAMQSLRFVSDSATTGMAEMRALLFELRPESLQVEGLVIALQKQAAAVHARNRIDVQTTLCEEPHAPLQVKEAIYRIAQEAMHNVVKHANASKIVLNLQKESDQLSLFVQDDGKGFNTNVPGVGLGLRSMRERVERVGGTLTVQSASGEGTRILALFPLQQHDLGA
jgi:PAS domain S-box-containing protein